MMNFQNFFTNPINVVAVRTFLPNSKFCHTRVRQKMGVVIITCYCMIICNQKRFLRNILVEIFEVLMFV